MANNKLLLETLAHVEEDAKKGLHNQDYFFRQTGCGTSYCFAGRALADAGFEPVWLDGVVFTAVARDFDGTGTVCRR